MSREHREYRETSTTVRSMAPRPMSPQAQLDSNLDSILEDLQASVSRPGSALGGSYGSREYYSTSNPAIISNEIPLGTSLQNFDDEHKIYKTTTHKSYNTYNVSSDRGKDRERHTKDVTVVRQNNINQLDSLLQDLQEVREGTLDRGTNSLTTSVTNVGTHQGLLEPMGSSTPRLSPGTNAVTRISQTNYQTSNDTLPLETRPRLRSPGDITYQRTETTTRDVFATDSTGRTYRATSPLRFTPTGPTLAADTTRSFSYTDHKTSSTLPAAHAALAAKPIITEVTEDVPLPLTQDILPPAATKVTTTVRTYTYELPGDVKFTTDPSSHLAKSSHAIESAESYKRESETSSKHVHGINDQFVASDPSRTASEVLYKHETSTSNTSSKHGQQHVTGSAYKHESSSGGTYAQTHKKDSAAVQSYQKAPEDPKTISHSYKYSSSMHERSFGKVDGQGGGSPGAFPVDGAEVSQVDSAAPKRLDDLMASFSTTNTNEGQAHGYSSGREAGYMERSVTSQGMSQGHAQGAGYGQGSGAAHSISQGHAQGHAHGVSQSHSYGMSQGHAQGISQGHAQGISQGHAQGMNQGHAQGMSQGHAQGHAQGMSQGYTQSMSQGYAQGMSQGHAQGMSQSHAQGMSQGHAQGSEMGYGQGGGAGKGEMRVTVPSRNIAGPPVYYPPGHEMFARKEAAASYTAAGGGGGASGGGGRASGAMYNAGSGAASGGSGYIEQGGKMKQSGKYKYEAESKSKSKSKGGSGGTVVPVCLPLCCGLPCVIM